MRDEVFRYFENLDQKGWDNFEEEFGVHDCCTKIDALKAAWSVFLKACESKDILVQKGDVEQFEKATGIKTCNYRGEYV